MDEPRQGAGLDRVIPDLGPDPVISSVLANSPDVIVRYDLALRRIYANPAFERLHGLTPPEYLGRKPSEVNAKGERLEQRLRAALDSGQTQEWDFEWTAADGRILWRSVRLIVERDAHGRPASLLSIATDITSRKRAEEALVTREREFRSLAENSGVDIMRWDPQGRVLYLNPRMERTLGMPASAVVGRTASEAFGEGAFPAISHATRAVVSDGVARTVEEVVPDADGRARTHQVQLAPERDAAGAVVAVIGIGHDITDRKRSEDAWQFVAQRGWSEDGEPFFPALVSYLGRTLQLDYVFIDKLDDDQPGMAETVALYALGEIAPNLRYALEDTPCQNVADRSACAYPQGIQQLFPRDRLLVEMQAESYVGVPLLDAAGRAIGLIAAMDRKPLCEPESVLGVLRLVAARATAELVRNRTDQALQAREREFRSLAENSPDFIVRYDGQARALYANPAVLARLRVAPEFLLGRTPSQSALPGNEAAMAEQERLLRGVLLDGAPAELELELWVPGEPVETHHVRLVAIKAPDGRIDGALALGRDVSERKRAEEVLRLREQEFRALVEQSPDLIERYDRQGRRVYANPALRDLLRDSAAMDEQPGRDGGVVMEAGRYRRMVQTVLATGRTKQAELRYRRADGSAGWIDARLCPETDGQGGVSSVFVVARDITQSIEQRERIQTLALSDPLTRLHNRQALYDHAPGLISEARRHGRKLGVMILDLDRFKDVNDTLGHAAGDVLLCEVAQRVAECTRGYDLLVRLGGDEFAIVASNLDDEVGMAVIADKIDKALSVPLQLGGRQVVVSASIGIALFPADGEQLEDLMAHADAAMYHAKRGGRNRYEFYRAEFSARARDRLALEHALRGAQDGTGLELHYQPLVALSGSRVVGAEALLRWRHPELGLLTPDRFITIAEETGLIVPIGRWVIAEAARMARCWNQGRSTPLKVAVNVSTRQFLRDDVAAVVRDALLRTGCQPQWLGIEVTESLLLEDSERIQRSLCELRTIGLEIAIDDFGTGYSALNYLSKFDVTCLKIDRQFVRDIEADPRQAELAKAFIGIARALRLSVVAEGVETPAQAAFLLEHGCDVGQGFLFCRPVSAEHFERGLREGHWGQVEFALA